MPPMASQGDSTPPSPDAPGGGGQPAGGSPRDSLPGLGDPSARPDEPVTAGLPVGAGIGPVAAGMVPRIDPATVTREFRPVLARLRTLAKLSSSTAETRAWVREVENRLGTPNQM